MTALDGKILVTGATGLIGNNVVRALLERNRSVRVLVREQSDPRPLEGLDVETRYGDIREPAAVRAACNGVSLVIHAAAKVSLDRWKAIQFREVNADGTRNVVNATLAAGARLVHVSTADTIGSWSLDEPADETSPFDTSHATPYSVSKLEAERIVQAAVDRGLDASIVNPAFTLGAWDWKPSSGQMLLAVSRGLGLFVPRGYGNFVDVRDVTSGILSAATHGRSGQRYLLTGQMLSYRQAWTLFASVTGSLRPIWQIGPIITPLSGLTGDVLSRLTGREIAMNSVALNAALPPANYSSQLAERELGFAPRPLRETVERTWEWFQAQRRKP